MPPAPEVSSEPLARGARRWLRSRVARAIGIVVMIATLGFAISRMDLRPSLRHLSVRVLSGAPEGNYHAIVERLAGAAAKRGGRIENAASAGSVENVQRLAAATRSCEVPFAIVQAGLPWPDTARLELVGSLAKKESMFVLGKDADRVGDFGTLRDKRIGIGPEGSGTAGVARQILESRDFQGLGLRLTHHTLAEQLDLAARGELDLAVFVMDEDAKFIEAAVRDRGLQIAGFPHADVVARRFPFLGHGRIGAGQYDPVRMLPPVDKEVLRVGTLVVGNGCASRSQTLGLMVALLEVFPDFVRHNKDAPNTSGLEVAPAAKSFFEHEGPEVLDEYLPRLSDVMPPGNWVHLVMAVSILFNLMGVANRFVLWRIDAARVKSEQEIAHCFGSGKTLGDIARIEPEGRLLEAQVGEEVDRVIAALDVLAARSRKLSLSVLVPMGGEMAYRYQENLVHETLAVLRAFRAKWEEARRAA